ncbi:MAG: thrombospondin type 3 repeat-containing protein [Lentisphaeria bacterium]
MEFLKRHYEKVVLGLFLVAMLGLCVLVWRNLGATDAKVTGATGSLGSDFQRKRPFTPLDPAALDNSALLADKSHFWNPATDPTAGGLFDPYRYIRCANAACAYLVPIEYAICPDCGTPQGEEKAGTIPAGLDSDGDGIPDEVEAKHAFLDPQNPEDAWGDSDNDGFTNLEEYKAGTDLALATSRPPLASRLRWLHIRQTPLDIVFRKMMRTGENVENWQFQFEVGGKTRWGQLGQMIEGSDYKLVEVKPNVREVPHPTIRGAKLTIDQSAVVVQKEGEESHPLGINQVAFAAGSLVDFAFIRNPADPSQTERLGELKAGSRIDLRLGSAPVETVVVKGVEPPTVIVQTLKADGTPGPEARIPRLDPARDYRAAARRGIFTNPLPAMP